MKIRDFKRLGLRMILNSFLTSMFITAMVIILASMTQVDFSSFVLIEQNNLTTINLFDQLMAALSNSLNSNVFTGFLATDFSKIDNILYLIIFSVVFYIAVYSVVTVGRDAYFLQNRAFRINSNLLLYGFDKKIYRKIMYAQLVRYGKIIFGFICFIVPGIYIFYKYRFLNYVMVQYPDKDIHEWISMNNQITVGRIWFLILLDISFIGWRLLNLVSFNLFKYFLEPYYQATYCELYVAAHQSVFGNNGYGNNPLITVHIPANNPIK